ncbi:MAG: hypothetical protein C4318_01805 [Acidimicrobiia bacterium]
MGNTSREVLLAEHATTATIMQNPYAGWEARIATWSNNPYGTSTTYFYLTNTHGDVVALELYYLRARWYDPGTGRFLSRDPMAGMVKHLASVNRQLYGARASSSTIDPSGMASRNTSRLRQAENAC